MYTSIFHRYCNARTDGLDIDTVQTKAREKSVSRTLIMCTTKKGAVPGWLVIYTELGLDK